MKKTLIATAVMLTLMVISSNTTYARPPFPGKSPVEMMDTDGDGEITETEWTAFHAKMFKELDKDSDGYLTEDEMRPPHHNEQKENN